MSEMTLRDVFAVEILKALISRGDDFTHWPEAELMKAYALADKMLKVREVGRV